MATNTAPWSSLAGQRPQRPLRARSSPTQRRRVGVRLALTHPGYRYLQERYVPWDGPK